jgi:acyl-homoserine-lactone acylase
VRLLITILFLTFLAGCAEKFNSADYLQLNKKYDVVIERDHLGVPHVMGERDIDTAFGFAYAQAEDNWQIIHTASVFIVAPMPPKTAEKRPLSTF